MIALVDTDVLIDVALDRKPFSDHSSALLDAAQRRSFHAFVAWHSISNFYYIVESSTETANAKNFIIDLLKFVEVAPTATKDALYAAQLRLTDFEDALQVAAARACKAELIVTRNVKHYKGSPTPAHTPAGFLRHSLP
ncbi:MAG: type II toxin-antitoxin system VapC family toxin [bacterium]